MLGENRADYVTTACQNWSDILCLLDTLIEILSIEIAKGLFKILSVVSILKKYILNVRRGQYHAVEDFVTYLPQVDL